MLKVENINKSFGKKQILENICMEVQDGHIFGLLGTNGAGKSTLLRTMAGIYRADSGTTLLDGKPIYENPESKEQVCYLSDDPSFLHAATIADMGRFQAAYYPTHDEARLKELCSRFSLPMDEKITSMSKGTQKRVQVCLALARRPRLLMCDETFDGLDPVMRESFRRTLSEETCDRGMVTVLAGHNQSEMEDICDSVGFLHQGKLLTAGDIDTVVNGIQKVQFAAEAPVDESVLESLHPLRLQKQGRLYVITVKGEKENTLQVLSGLNPVFLESLPLSLEEVFILEMEEQGYAQ